MSLPNRKGLPKTSPKARAALAKARALPKARLTKERAKANTKAKAAPTHEAKVEAKVASADIGAATGPTAVHNLSGITLPPEVQLLLSKGLKYIPDLSPVRRSHLATACDNLVKGVDAKKFFEGREEVSEDREEVSRYSKLRVVSKWTPPKSSFGEKVRHTLNYCLESWRPTEVKRNWSRLDKVGLSWLRRNVSSVLVVPADKNLGVVVVSRSWAEQRCVHHLMESCAVQSRFMALSSSMQACNEAFGCLNVLKKRKAISSAEYKYVCHHGRRLGSGGLRVLPKIHKCPVGSRPIFTPGSLWTVPFARLIFRFLSPLTSGLVPDSILLNTDSFQKDLSRFGQWNWELVKDSMLCTVDIINLYPSITLSHLLSVLSVRIRLKYEEVLAENILKLLEFVLKFHDLEWQGKFYRVTSGIPTGSTIAVIIANVYLHELDRLLSTLGCVRFYKRFVDDIFVVLERGKLNEFLGTATSFHHSIKFEAPVVGDRIPFLDLWVKIGHNCFEYELFSKPSNLYLYLPFQSGHPRFVFRSILQGECLRYIRRNSTRAQAQKHLNMLAVRFVERGYPIALIQNAIHSAWARASSQKIRGSVPKTARSKHHLVVRWSGSLGRNFNGLFRKVHRILPQFCVSFRVQKNLFRHTYYQWRELARPQERQFSSPK
eukprot:6488353-Amphidinium_carterae.1